jgi:hypothetical protein
MPRWSIMISREPFLHPRPGLPALHGRATARNGADGHPGGHPSSTSPRLKSRRRSHRVESGRPARGRKSTTRTQTEQPELAGDVRRTRTVLHGLYATHRLRRRRRLHREVSPTRASGGIGLGSSSSTIQVRDTSPSARSRSTPATGRSTPVGDAPRQPRAPGRGATAPAVDRRRRRGRSPSHRKGRARSH